MSNQNPDLFDGAFMKSMKKFWSDAGHILADRPFPAGNLAYHYTSADSAFSILENQQLWVSNIGYLNDLNEMMCARNVFGNLPDFFPELKDNIYAMKLIGGIVSNYLSYIPSSPFVMSFCEQGDALGQWRGYGNGVSLAFDVDDLERVIEGVNITRVIYDVDGQSRVLKSLLDNSVDDIKKIVDEIGGESVEYYRYLGFVSGYLLSMAVRMKSFHFHEEKEWRMTYSRPSDLHLSAEPEVNFRMRGKCPVPYVKLRTSTGLLPIRGAMLSPNSHPLLKPALEALFRKKGYEDFVVKNSVIPFRD